MRVGLFVTCLVDLMRPEIGLDSLDLLEAAGCEVYVPRSQTCCGQPAVSAGEQASARKLAVKLLHEFTACDYLVLPSGSCAATIRRHYLELVADDAELLQQMQQLVTKTHELTEFLQQVVNWPGLPKTLTTDNGQALSVTYHDSCSGLRTLGIREQPRQLLAKIPQVKLKEMPGAEECCGFGGAFALQYDELSCAIADRKCASIHACGAAVVAGGDLGCLLHIEGRLRHQGDETTQLMHIAEILAGRVFSSSTKSG